MGLFFAMGEYPIIDELGQFFYPERGQKQTFFDPLPPHLVHVVIEWTLSLRPKVYDSIF